MQSDEEDTKQKTSVNDSEIIRDNSFPADMPRLEHRDQSLADTDSDEADRSPSPPTLEQVDLPDCSGERRDYAEKNAGEARCATGVKESGCRDAEEGVVDDSRICDRDIFEQMSVDIDNGSDEKESINESLSLDKSDIEDLETANKSSFDSFDELSASGADDEKERKLLRANDDVFMGNSSGSGFSSVLNTNDVTRKGTPNTGENENEEIRSSSNGDRPEDLNSVRESASESEVDDLSRGKTEDTDRVAEADRTSSPLLSSSDNELDAFASSDDDDNDKIIASNDDISKLKSGESNSAGAPREARFINPDGSVADAPRDASFEDALLETKRGEVIPPAASCRSGGFPSSPNACPDDVIDVHRESCHKEGNSDVVVVNQSKGMAEETSVSADFGSKTYVEDPCRSPVVNDCSDAGAERGSEAVRTFATKSPAAEAGTSEHRVAQIHHSRNDEQFERGHRVDSEPVETGSVSVLPTVVAPGNEAFQARRSSLTPGDDRVVGYGEPMHGAPKQQNLNVPDMDRAAVLTQSTPKGQCMPQSPLRPDPAFHKLSVHVPTESDCRLPGNVLVHPPMAALHSGVSGSPGRVQPNNLNTASLHGGMSSVSSPSGTANMVSHLRTCGSGQIPSTEPISSHYPPNFRRQSVGSSQPPHPLQMASPGSSAAEIGMPSPKTYYADFNVQRQSGYGGLPMNPLVQESCYSAPVAARPHSMKGSPGSCVETAAASPASGCTLLSPAASTNARTHFNMSCRSPASRVDQSPASAGSSGYGSVAVGGATAGSRQMNFSRPNPSPSSHSTTKRNSGGNVGGNRQHPSPLEVNVFSPTTAADSSPSVHSNCMAVPPACVTPDVGLPFHFLTNNAVAVPVTASSYSSIPSPTPRSIQLLSPSASSGAGNNIISIGGVGGYQRQVQHQPSAQLAAASLPQRSPSVHYVQQQHQQPTAAPSLLNYGGVPPAPSPQIYASSRTLDQRFAPDVAQFSQQSTVAAPATCTTGRQARNARSSTAAAGQQQPNCSLAKLQQLTNQLNESDLVSHRHQPTAGRFDAVQHYAMSGGSPMGMLLAQNVGSTGVSEVFQSSIPINNGAPANSGQVSKQSSRRRAAGVSSASKTTAPPAGIAAPLPFSTNMAAAAASYNMLGAFSHASQQHTHQQTRTPPPFDYHHYFAANAAAAAGFFNHGTSQLPMQMMPFNMHHPRTQSAIPSAGAPGFPQSQPMQGQGSNPVYAPYGYGGLPPEAFNNSTCR
jgi:hypothetical protein